MKHNIHGEGLDMLLANAFGYQLHLKTPDMKSAIETHLHNVTLQSDNLTYYLDLGRDLCLTRSRWNTLVKMYLDKATLARFIAGCKQIYEGDCRKGASTSMVARNVVYDPRRKSQRWGNCILGFSFTVVSGQPQLTMYSRCTYNGYMAFLDAAIAHVLAREIGDPAKISFVWHVTTLQVSAVKSIPHVISRNEWKAAVKVVKTPTTKLIGEWIKRIEDAYKVHGVDMILRKNEKYGQLRRMKRRWLEVKGDLKQARRKPLPVGQLTFEKAYVPEA